MRSLLKAVSKFFIFVLAYFLISTLTFMAVVLVNQINIGDVSFSMNWRVYGIAAFASAMAGYLGVAIGRAVLDSFFKPYPAKFIGVLFTSLLGFWFALTTIIYVVGGVGILLGDDAGDWPPDGELSVYFLNLIRAVVAIVCVWLMLVKQGGSVQTE